MEGYNSILPKYSFSLSSGSFFISSIGSCVDLIMHIKLRNDVLRRICKAIVSGKRDAQISSVWC